MKHLSSSLEDYLEAIYILKEKKGFARVSEIANFLNVSMSSVNSAIKTLAKKVREKQKRFIQEILL
ncbi:MAG: hypothetical protein ABDH49_02880 [Candidatus Hydrothermales bacterium]